MGGKSIYKGEEYVSKILESIMFVGGEPTENKVNQIRQHAAKACLFFKKERNDELRAEGIMPPLVDESVKGVEFNVFMLSVVEGQKLAKKEQSDKVRKSSVLCDIVSRVSFKQDWRKYIFQERDFLTRISLFGFANSAEWAFDISSDRDRERVPSPISEVFQGKINNGIYETLSGSGWEREDIYNIGMIGQCRAKEIFFPHFKNITLSQDILSNKVFSDVGPGRQHFLERANEKKRFVGDKSLFAEVGTKKILCNIFSNIAKNLLETGNSGLERFNLMEKTIRNIRKLNIDGRLNPGNIEKFMEEFITNNMFPSIEEDTTEYFFDNVEKLLHLDNGFLQRIVRENSCFDADNLSGDISFGAIL